MKVGFIVIIFLIVISVPSLRFCPFSVFTMYISFRKEPMHNLKFVAEKTVFPHELVDSMMEGWFNLSGHPVLVLQLFTMLYCVFQH